MNIEKKLDNLENLLGDLVVKLDQVIKENGELKSYLESMYEHRAKEFEYRNNGGNNAG
jgi:hypothetical protein